MNSEDHIKLFGMSHALLERELDKIEALHALDLQREVKDDRDQDYYPQFAQALRTEAAGMARHYELFYCLEKSIRSLVAETLKGAHGETWWTKCVPKPVQDNVQKKIQREIVVNCELMGTKDRVGRTLVRLQYELRACRLKLPVFIEKINT